LPMPSPGTAAILYLDIFILLVDCCHTTLLSAFHVI
jgi:hypothetical protein